MRSRSLLLLSVLLVLSGGLWLCDRMLGQPEALAAGGGGQVGRVPHVSGALPVDGGVGRPDGPAGGGREALPTEPLAGAGGTEELAAEPEDDRSRLTGTVVRPGGAPVPGAVVLAERSRGWFVLPADLEPVDTLGSDPARHEAVTDEEGRFELRGVSPGRLCLAIRADGLAPLRRSALEVPEHEEHDLGTFSMELGVVLAGRVTGSRGAPLEGVEVLAAVTRAGGFTRVELPGRGIPVATTDADGRFVVGSQAPGAWHLVFDAPGYRVAELTGSQDPAGSSDRALRVQLDPGLDIVGRVRGIDPVAQGPLRVTGRLTDEQPTGAAEGLGEAERLRARHAEVREDGSFRLAGLAPGVRYRLQLEELGEAREGVAETWERTRGAAHRDAQSGDRAVELEVVEEAVLRFLARSSGGAPLETLEVHLAGSGLVGGGAPGGEGDGAPVDFPGGRVAYTGLRPARDGSQATLRVRAEGHEDLLREGLLLRPGEELDLGELELRASPRGRVRVVDDGTGEPVEGARVHLVRGTEAERLARLDREPPDQVWSGDSRRMATTDGDGLARPTALEGVVCAARATAEGYLTSEEGRLLPPFDRTLELRLKRAGRVRVRVEDAEGHPVSGMYVEHEEGSGPEASRGVFMSWDGGGGAENRTGEDGVILFEGLAEGLHRFRALERRLPWGQSEGAGPGAEAEVSLRTGEEAEVLLRVEPRGGLRVTLLEGGEPLRGALARLEPLESEGDAGGWWAAGQEDPRTQISDHAGRLHFVGLRVGGYRMRVSHPQRRMTAVREVRVERRAPDLRIELGVATIEGRLVDPTGKAVTGVQVLVQADGDQALNRGLNDYRMRVTEDQDGDADYEYEEVQPWAVTSDGEGRFLLRGVLPEVPLTVQLLGEFVVHQRIAVGRLGPDEHWGPRDIEVERAGGLRITLDGVPKEQRSSYELRLTRGEGESAERRRVGFRNWRAQVWVSSLRPGTWRLELALRGAQEPVLSREVEVRVGHTERLSLRP